MRRLSVHTAQSPSQSCHLLYAPLEIILPHCTQLTVVKHPQFPVVPCLRLALPLLVDGPPSGL